MQRRKITRMGFAVIFFVLFGYGNPHPGVMGLPDARAGSGGFGIAVSPSLLFAIALQDTKAPELEAAKSFFDEGEFDQAISLLNKLVEKKTLPIETRREAGENLAMAYAANHQDDAAREIFTRLLTEDKDYKPSEDWWPHQRALDQYFEALKRLGLPFGIAPPGPGIQTIAIVDFDNNAIHEPEKYANLGKALAKILISDFNALSNLRVVERERLQFLIDELKIQRSDVDGKPVFDPGMTSQVGKMLGAHAFIFGSFITDGKTMRLDARIVKTETGEIFKTDHVEGKPDKIFALANQLTKKIADNLEVAIKKTEEKDLENRGKELVPLEAVALFGDAVADANQEQYKDAYQHLEKALVIAPNFAKARQMMATLRPLVL